ncbi:hypothetical protein CISIN_1g035157mg [Citrus sinensis]|uniref:Uncharacterized protein n=1 Tax=Citrus sinensis TaxID=2711 RepID=A0A067CZG6_CITSI|nr:hypothetical protein CISIN_1g035157mg [Citrus sinensis]
MSNLVVPPRLVFPHKVIFLQEFLPSRLLRGQLFLRLEEGVSNIVSHYNKLCSQQIDSPGMKAMHHSCHFLLM